MAERYDVMCPIEKGEGDAKKTFWVKCGVAFAKEGGKFSIMLDVLPTNGRLVMMLPKPKGEGSERF